MTFAQQTEAGVEPAVGDRWLKLPAILLVGFSIALIVIWAGPFGIAFLGAPLLCLLWGGSAIVGVAPGLSWAIQGTWRRAISWLVFPAVTLVAALNFDVVWTGAITAGNRVHFWVMRPHYL